MAAQKRNLLDDLQLRRWLSAGEPVARSDGDGLTFTLSAAGTAAFVLRYRYGRFRRELTLGNYPDLSLAEARKLARETRVKIDRGADPAAEKKIEKSGTKTTWLVREVAEDYKSKKLTPAKYSESTIYYRKADIDQVIIPKLGSMDVRHVKPSQIVHTLETADRTWTITKRLLTSFKKVFGHACGIRLIESNPCAGIELTAFKGERPPVRKRIMLTPTELTALLKDADAALGVENALAFRILLATCTRGIELVKARWEHLDLDQGTWWVPDESVKTRSGFLVPLCKPVVGWFKKLQKLACGSDWVLPARRADRIERHGGDIHVGRTTLWAAISRAFEREELDIRRFTPHDTRSTAKGHLRNLGVSNEVSEIALNHKLRGMEAIYDVREEIPERRVALELWTKFIGDCERGDPAKHGNRRAGSKSRVVEEVA